MRAIKKKWLFAVTIILLAVIAVVICVFWRPWHHESKKQVAPIGVVPTEVKNAVSFPVYYPDQSKLPAGYRLNTDSFSTPVKNGVSYSVSYDTNKKIVFSVQAKPSDNELESFKSNYIPLRTSYQTPIGQADIGAYNNHGKLQTLASLPTKTNAWIIITAPYDINQDQLKKVLNALTQ